MKKTAICLFILAGLIQSGLCQNVGFTGYLLYKSTSSRVFSVTTGDLDMDTHPDSLPEVIAGSYSRKLDWFENEGQGTGFILSNDKLAVDVKRESVSGDIVIHFGNNGSSQYKVELVDITGRICFSAVSGTSGIVIQANKFKQGIYLLRVASSVKQTVVKLFID